MTESQPGRRPENPFSAPITIFDSFLQEQSMIARRTVLATRANRMLWGRSYNQTPEALDAELAEYGRPILGEQIAGAMSAFVPVEPGTSPRPKIREDAAGVGAITGALLAQGYDVTAAELNPEFAAYIARKYGTRYPGQLRTVVSDMNAPPEPDEYGAYDGITSAWSYRYVPEPEKYMTYQAARLKPNGANLWVIHEAEAAPWRQFSGNPQQVTDRDGLAELGLSVGFDEAIKFDGDPVPPFNGFPVIVRPQFLALIRH